MHSGGHRSLSPVMTDPVAVWRELCDRLAELGEHALGVAPDAAEQLEHLVDQATLWLAWAGLHDDPARPFFHRHNDLVSQWGGPNADNVYRHARIEPGRRYVLRGRMHSCEEFLLAVRAGFMHSPVWGTLAQVAASDLGIGPGDDFEIRIGGDEPGAIEIPDGAVMVSVREYYFDWRPEEPATFTIECLDPAPVTVPSAEAQAGRLDRAVAEFEASLEYWQQYMDDHREKRIDNTYTASTVQLAQGLAAARYEFCFWDLEPDQALVIESEAPAAKYWSFQLYRMATFELVDPYEAITSRNHVQTALSQDGKVRMVVSGSDPGVANWLDTRGRRNGLCTLRWFWPDDDSRPTVSTTTVPVDEVADLLAGEPTVDPGERAEELAGRQAHLRWRFRV